METEATNEEWTAWASAPEPSSADRALARRALAALIDLVPLTVLLLGFAHRWGAVEVGDGFRVSLYGWSIVGFSLAALGYYWVQETTTDTTFGKWICGLAVVDRSGGRPRRFGIVTRTILRAIDGFPILYLVGFVAAASDPEGRRVGDRAADTLVRPRKRSAARGVLLLTVAVATTVIGVVMSPRTGAVLGPHGGFDTGRLLTLDDVESSPTVGGAFSVVDLAELSVDPDPRAPCGEPVPSWEPRIRGGVAYQSADVFVQYWVLSGQDLLTTYRTDMTPGCPEFLTDTPFGHRQRNRFAGAYSLAGVSADHVAVALEIQPEGGGSIAHVAASLTRVGDNELSVVVVFGLAPIPTEVIEDLTLRALRRAG